METPQRRAPPVRKTDEGAANSYYFRKKRSYQGMMPYSRTATMAPMTGPTRGTMA